MIPILKALLRSGICSLWLIEHYRHIFDTKLKSNWYKDTKRKKLIQS